MTIATHWRSEIDTIPNTSISTKARTVHIRSVIEELIDSDYVPLLLLGVQQRMFASEGQEGQRRHREYGGRREKRVVESWCCLEPAYIYRKRKPYLRGNWMKTNHLRQTRLHHVTV